MIFFALEGLADLVEASHILIFDLLLHGVVGTLTRLVFEVNVGKIRVVNAHLADGSQKFGTV